MKKILSLFLVALTALGLTATIYAVPTDTLSVSWLPYDNPVVSQEERTGVNKFQIAYEGFGEETYVAEPFSRQSEVGNAFIEFKTTKAFKYTLRYEDYNDSSKSKILSGIFPGKTLTFKHDNGTLRIEQLNLVINEPVNYSYDNDFFFWLQCEIIDEDLRPAISGQETFATNVDEARPVEYFISYLRAIDDIDGDISDDIYIITDNYTPNKSVLGSHEVKVGVEDSSGNISEFIFKVYVSDITKPIISGNQSIVSVGYKETYDFENFRKTLTVTDNYSSLTNADIKLKTDNYTPNKGNLGTYEIIFEAKDSSGNAGTFTKQVKVIDNIAPVFGGVQLIEKPYTEVMTLADILGKVTASDEIDGNLTAKIKVVNDGFTGNSNKVGTYHIELSVTDNAGNTTTRTITIKVFDNVPAGWYVMNGVSINLTPGTELTRAQIIDILHKTGQIIAPASSMITYDVDTYSENIGTPGSYMLSFSSKLTNGVVNNYTYTVNVLDELQNGDNEVVKGESSLTKVWNFIQNVYIAIVNFFKAIWNAIVWVINLFGTGLEYIDYSRFK